MHLKPIFMIVFLLMGNGVWSQTSEKKRNVNAQSVAIEGYDLVSYFDSESPQKGNAEHAITFNGVVYWFFLRKKQTQV